MAGLVQRGIDNLKSGNLGVLPIVLGLVFIVVFFSFKATNFFTADNFDNVIIQMAGTAMLAFGVVFVLLLGEIDLSISYVAGIGAITVAELQLPGSGHQVNGLLAMVAAVAVLRVIGAVQGSIVAFVGVPSFVVTLAGFLIWQGVILQGLEEPGSIIIQDRWINYTASYFFSNIAGWLIAGIITGLYVLTCSEGMVGKRRAGVAIGNPWLSHRQAGRCRRRGLRHRCHLQPRAGAARSAARRRPGRHLPRRADVPRKADDLRPPRLRRRRQCRGCPARRHQRPADPHPRVHDLGRDGRNRRHHPRRQRELGRPQLRRRTRSCSTRSQRR